ncbi:hypothetical protein CMI37_37190 [Candidatus Pacearchaeota archaeon]|nr:hypothetical protein [Candidatus Pacearchaeota archaeon]|tara:strand:+ start:1007 stop:1852 length:846 start_codon:yes stop_codon:yes gene_type:complete
MKENCPVCNSEDISIKYKLSKYNILSCNYCKLLFNEAGIRDASAQFYDEDYYEKLHKHYFSSKKFRPIFLEAIEQLKDFTYGKKLLDCGCGTGNFLILAESNGYSAHGIDISEYACKIARENNHLKNISVGAFQNTKFRDNEFDIITMFDFLEHCYNPDATLKEAYRILKPYEYLFIETPNEDSIMTTIAGIIYRLSFGLIRKPVELSHPIHHNYHFSNESLTMLLKRNKFKVVFRKNTDLSLKDTDIAQKNLIYNILIRFIYAIQKVFNRGWEQIVYAEK